LGRVREREMKGGISQLITSGNSLKRLTGACIGGKRTMVFTNTINLVVGEW